jgi:O-antigen ligase
MQLKSEDLFNKSYFLIFILLPFSTSVDTGAVINFGFLLHLILLPVCFLYVFVNKKNIKLNKDNALFLVVLLILIFWIFATLIWSGNLTASALRASYILSSSFIYLSFLAVINKKKYIETLIRCINIFVTILSLYFIINFLISVFDIGLAKTVTQRFVGGAMALPWGASNIISVVLLSGLITLFLAECIIKEKVSNMVIMLVSISVLLTLSRTGTLILILAILLISLSRTSVLKSIFINVLALIILPIITFISYLSLSSFDFFANRYSSSNFTSMNGRGEIWSHYIDLINKDPLGLHGFYGALVSNTYTPHNIFISFYYDTGIVGFLLLVLLVFLIGKSVLKSAFKLSFLKEPFKFLLILLLPLMLLLNLSFEDGIYVPATWYMFFSMVVLFQYSGLKNEN